MGVKVSSFANVHDTKPEARDTSWAALCTALSRFDSRKGKDGRLWSPVEFDGSRSNDAAKVVSCLVLDFDGGARWEEFEEAWSHLAYAIHTTHRHTEDHPRWRAVFPLSRPVAASDWPAICELASDFLGGGHQETHSDPARMYYLPSHPPGATHFATRHEGRELDPDAFAPEPEPDQAERAERNGSMRVGDRFNGSPDSPTWRQLVEEAGGAFVRSVGGREYYVRPGKRASQGISLVVGVGRRGDLARCHTTSWPPLAPRSYDKFGFVAAIRHGGDFQAAARDIGKAMENVRKPNDNSSEPERSEDAPEIGTDLDRASAFVAAKRDTLRYVPERGTWISRNGATWRECAGDDDCATYAASQVHAAWSEALPKAAAKLKSRTSINSTVGLAKTFPAIVVPSRSLDADPMLLGVANGVLDLRIGRLVDPGERIVTMRSPVRWDPDAICPEFERFLTTIFQEKASIIHLVGKMLGYSLTGRTNDKGLVILYGERGRNGKSTLLRVIRHVYGDYTRAIDKKLLVDGRGDGGRFSVAQLEGVRLATASEVARGAKLDVEFIKAFTGGDSFFAERKGQDGYDFAPVAKVWYAVNSLPHAQFDPSLRSRLVPVPFLQSFYGELDPSHRDGDIAPDPMMDAKLEAEAPGILRLIVGYLQRYLHEGLSISAEVRSLADDYERANDHVALWLGERCEMDPEGRSRVSDLFRDYAEFCKQMRLPVPGRYNDFVQRLKAEEGLRFTKAKNVSSVDGVTLAQTVSGQSHGGQYWHD